MVDKFGMFSKLREIVRLASKEKIPDPLTLVRLLKERADKPNSTSPFRRPVANDNGPNSFAGLEFDTIASHVRFAEKLDILSYRDPDQDPLPGMEQPPQEFSEAVLDQKILKYLEGCGVTKTDLLDLIAEVDIKDIDSLLDALQAKKGRVVSDDDFKKCVRLLGDCGITIRFSRKKTYAKALLRA